MSLYFIEADLVSSSFAGYHGCVRKIMVQMQGVEQEAFIVDSEPEPTLFTIDQLPIVAKYYEKRTGWQLRIIPVNERFCS